jgi:hypothetical protein
MLLLCAFQAQAQVIPGATDYHELGLLFSQYTYTGSARIAGLAGAQIGLGGDISSALSNPAGLGFYNRSELSLTPAYTTFSHATTYNTPAPNGFLTGDQDNTLGTFGIDNIGIVFHKGRPEISTGPFRGGAFAISFSKINNFNGEMGFAGTNVSNDIIDNFIQNANAGNFNVLTNQAYEVYAIDEFVDPNNNQRFFDRTVLEYPTEEYPIQQSEIIRSSGSQSQLSFSYGANFSDKIYIGAGLGLVSLRYNQTKDYLEVYSPGGFMERLQIREVQEQSGTGINLTGGIVFRPVPVLTLGFSVISPTWFSMSEYANANTLLNWDNFPYDDNTTLTDEEAFNESIFDYRLQTPTRLNFGSAFFFNKNGFITADVELVNYTSIRVTGQGSSLEDQNMLIDRLYASAVNFRIGAEYRYQQFRIRGGYGLNGDPFADSNELNRSRQHISGGLGYRSRAFFADLAVRYAFFENRYSPYVLDPSEDPVIFRSPFADISSSSINAVLSIGFFF